MASFVMCKSYIMITHLVATLPIKQTDQRRDSCQKLHTNPCAYIHKHQTVLIKTLFIDYIMIHIFYTVVFSITTCSRSSIQTTRRLQNRFSAFGFSEHSPSCFGLYTLLVTSVIINFTLILDVHAYMQCHFYMHSFIIPCIVQLYSA